MSTGAAQFAEVVLVNFVLSGDNALVIAMATLRLPKAQQRGAMVFGTALSVVLRVALTLVAGRMLQLPYLQASGGLLLVYLAMSLILGQPDEKKMTEDGEKKTSEGGEKKTSEGSEKKTSEGSEKKTSEGGEKKTSEGSEKKTSEGSEKKTSEGGGRQPPPARMAGAVVSIALADAAMSVDNILALAGISAGNEWLLTVGLLVSVSLIMFASAAVSAVLVRYPLLVYLGAGVLAWTAGGMIGRDPAVSPFFAAYPYAPAVVVATAVVASYGLTRVFRWNG